MAVSPDSPCGIPKSICTPSDVGIAVAVAGWPASRVVVGSTVTTGVLPFCPSGMVKFKIAFCAVPGAPVVVLPIVIVAAVPSCLRSPSGIVKLRTGQQHEPEFVTDAAVPG